MTQVQPIEAPPARLPLGWTTERAALDLAGYLAPYPLAEPARAEAARPAHNGKPFHRNPHTSSALVRALLRDPALVARIEALFGPGLRLWRSAFFAKTAGAAEIGWHHDKHFYSGDEADIRLDEIGSHLSVLFGLTEISQATGMIEVIPGSHRVSPELERDSRPYHQRPKTDHMMNSLSPTVLAGARPVPIAAGSFLVFHSALLHRSLPHAQGPDRLGLAIRLIRPGLDVPADLAGTADVMPFPPHG